MLTLKASPCDEAIIRSGPHAEDCAQKAKPWVLVATILGSSLVFIDGSVVNVALPTMQAQLAASVAEMQWVVNAYTLLLAALILVGGAAGDRFGRRRIFLIGTVIFATASLGCGLAANTGQLIIGRAIQGLGGALLVPSSLAIISAAFDAQERGRAIGTWAGFSAITTAIGPVLGGWLVDIWSWHAIFLINVPLAVITIAIALWRVPESYAPERDGVLDYWGALLVAFGLGAVTYGLIASAELGWTHPRVLGTLVSGAVLLMGFVWVESRSPAPMVPLTLFQSPLFSGVNLVTLLLYFALGGAFFLLPFNLIQVQNYPVMLAGAAFLPFTLVMGALSRWSGGLLDRYGAQRPLVIGPMITALGLALFAVPGVGGSYWITFFPAMTVLGLGMAVSVAPLSTTVMNAVADRHAGTASGINNTVSRVAMLLAVAVLGILALALFSNALQSRLTDLNIHPAMAAAVQDASYQLAGLELPKAVQGEMRQALETAIDAAFVASFRVLMLGTAGLALASALCAWLMIHSKTNSSA
jgi:EmrB/QacA subfamily drug resistance transporter